MKAGLFASLALAGALLLGAPQAGQAGELSPAELKPALEQLLREHPEVVIDFLKEHCEDVLDIAQLGSDTRRMAKFDRQWAKDEKEPKKFRDKDRLTLGPKDAKVRVAVFTDFTCTYCQRGEKTVEELVAEYGNKVAFVFKLIPMEPEDIGGLAAQYSVALSMLDRNLGWKFYRTVFREHAELVAKGEEFLRKTAVDLGVDMQRLDSQRRTKTVADMLQEDQDDADDLDVEGTPYFLVNNLVIRGAEKKDIFVRAIQREMAAGKGAGKPAEKPSGRKKPKATDLD